MKNKNTKLHYYEYFKKSSNKSSKIKRKPPSLWPDNWKKISFKGYPRFENFLLNYKAWDDQRTLLVDTILARRSSKKPSKNKHVTLDDLSYLLLGGAITAVKDNNIYYKSYRAQPSAGSRFSLEIYPLIFSSKDLKPGAYHYHARIHSLEYMWPIDSKILKDLAMQQDFVSKSRVFFLITALIERTTIRYSERGFRYALLEAGHLAQNISLLAIAKGFNVCPIGDLYESGFMKILNLNEKEELVLYGLSVL